MITRILAASLIALALCGAAQAADPYVTGTYKPLVQGYQVQFTLHNTLLTETLVTFLVGTADAASVTGPAGWSIYQNFRQVEWIAQAIGSDVQPGSSLGGFEFVTQSAPGTLFTLMHAGAGGDYSGSVTPELVPEPGGLIGLASGLVSGLGAFALPLLRRRGRR